MVSPPPTPPRRSSRSWRRPSSHGHGIVTGGRRRGPRRFAWSRRHRRTLCVSHSFAGHVPRRMVRCSSTANSGRRSAACWTPGDRAGSSPTRRCQAGPAHRGRCCSCPVERDLVGRPLPEIVARQWSTTVTTLLDDLERLEPERSCAVRYEDVVADPDTQLRRVCAVVGLEWDRPLLGPLPPSRTTLDPTVAEKWRRNETDIDGVWSWMEAAASGPDGRIPDDRAHGDARYHRASPSP